MSHRHGFTPKGTIDSKSLAGEIGVTTRYITYASGIAKYVLDVHQWGVVAGAGEGPTDRVVRIDASHAHNFSGSADSTDYSGGSECRPNNYTIRVWKRTA